MTRAPLDGTALERLLDPRGIAIVGASADLSRIGGQPIRALCECGYKGAVYPVNPKYEQINGLACYPSAAAVPQPCDVALVAVPAKLVPQTLIDCGKAGIAFAVVLSAGFKEIGEKGAALEAALRDAIRESGVRVIGPNCQGFMNLKQRVYCGFGAPFMNFGLKAGSIALVSQSGGFGFAVMNLADRGGLAFNYVVSTGNETDIGLLDLIEALLERDDVDAVATYMEGVAEGARLRRIGERALVLGKPILVWKVGNSSAGREAAASHTANLTAGYELYRCAFRDGGFIEVYDVDDLVDRAKAFAQRRLPPGPNAAVISISGGAGVLLADRCESLGVGLPPLAPQTLATLREFVPEFSSLLNPIDVTAQAVNDLSMLNRTVTTVLGDAHIDQVIVFNASVPGAAASRLATELAGIKQRTHKPVLVGWSALPGTADEAMEILEQHAIPCFPTPGRAAIGAAALNEFAAKGRRLAARKPLARLIEPQPLDIEDAAGALGERRAKACLARYGIPVVREVAVPLAQIDTLSASPLPFPLVAKLDSPDLPHKTEAGAVRVGLRDLDELKRAAREMLEAVRSRQPQARIDGLLLQEMASGIEVLAGVVNDPFFGPTVAFGLGGIYSEVLRDVTHRFAPFGVDTAREMIGEIKGARLLAGFRGQPPCDTEALAQALSRLSLLAADHAQRIAEIDVNPIFVRAQGQGVVAADALLVLRTGA